MQITSPLKTLIRKWKNNTSLKLLHKSIKVVFVIDGLKFSCANLRIIMWWIHQWSHLSYNCVQYVLQCNAFTHTLMMTHHQNTISTYAMLSFYICWCLINSLINTINCVKYFLQNEVFTYTRSSFYIWWSHMDSLW